MKEYKIWLATSAAAFFEIEKQHRTYAGPVQAENLDNAFMKGQNFDHHWNLDAPCRSVSIGDVIQDDHGYHMVRGFGFKTLDVKEDSEFEQMPVIERDDLLKLLSSSNNNSMPYDTATDPAYVETGFDQLPPAKFRDHETTSKA
jgi:hypothetical protein